METIYKRLLVATLVLLGVSAVGQVPPLKNPAYLANLKAVSGGGGGGGGALTIDSRSLSSDVVATTVSWTHTFSGSDRRAIIGIGVNGSQTITGVTIGGSSTGVTLLMQTNAVGTYGVTLFDVVAPASGSQTIEATASGSTSLRGACISFHTAHQSSIGAAVGARENSAPSDPATVTATTASGEIVVDVVITGSSTITVGANQDSTSTEADGAGGGSFSFGMSTQAGADGGVMSWTHSSTFWAIGAVSVKPAP